MSGISDVMKNVSPAYMAYRAIKHKEAPPMSWMARATEDKKKSPVQTITGGGLMNLFKG